MMFERQQKNNWVEPVSCQKDRDVQGKSSSIQSFLLYLILLVNAFQYSFWATQESVYNVLRISTTVLCVFLFLFSVNFGCFVKTLRKYQLFHLMLLLSTIFIIASFLFFALGANLDFSYHRDLIIVFLVLMIGYNLNIKEKEYKRFVWVYIFVGAFSAFSFIFQLGWEIPEYYIQGIYKNQLAPFFAILAIQSLGFIQKRKCTFVPILCLVLFIAVIAILRARTSLLSLFLILTLYVIFSASLSLQIKILFVLIVAVIASMNIDVLYTILFSGKDAMDVDSVSSGRVSRIIETFDFLSKNLLTGSLGDEQYRGGIVHVYVLKGMLDYGLLLFLPIITLYLYLFVSVIKQSFSKNISDRDKLMPFSLLFIFLVSFGEYSYPFSPISSIFFAYLSYGFFLKKKLPARV